MQTTVLGESNARLVWRDRKHRDIKILGFQAQENLDMITWYP